MNQITPSVFPKPPFLARAFSGQLVPQDPNDESAEKLLERIKMHHEAKSRRDDRK